MGKRQQSAAAANAEMNGKELNEEQQRMKRDKKNAPK